MKIRKEIKIGIFAIVVLAATFLTIDFLKGNDIFGKSHTFYAKYADIEGIAESTPVFVKGYRAGSVTSLKYGKSDGLYTARVSISDEYDIPKDSYLEIYSSDILGSRSIRVIMGNSDKMASDGDTLGSRIEADPLSAIVSGIVPLENSLHSLIGNFDKAVVSINSILDGGLREDISMISADLRKSAANISDITAGIESQGPRIDSIIHSINDIAANFANTAESLDRTVKNAEAITVSLKEADLKNAVLNLRDLLEKASDPSSSIGKLLTTDSLHNAVNSLATDLDTLVKRIERDPKKYIKISVF